MTDHPIRFDLTERGYKCCRAAFATMLGAVRELRDMYQRHVAATELDRALQAKRKEAR